MMMSSNALLSPPNEKDSKLWNDIVSAFREDGFPNLSNVNGAIREELLSLYRRLSSSDKDDDTSTNPSKFVIAWEAFASNNANIKDDVKSIPNAENIESFREYILKDVILVQKDEITRVGVVGSKSKNQKKKKLSKFEKHALKKARLMTMGEHLEMHDEDVDGKMEVKEDSAAEEEPLLKTPFKETTENNNSMNLPSAFSVEMKTPGSYRKAKKKTSSSELVKTIFEGSSFKSSSSSNAEKEITLKIQTSSSSSPHQSLFMRDRIEDKVALLKNKFKELKEEEEQEEEEEQKGQIIGRVCCDSSDRQELQLESSDGSRVKLELRSVENEYSLFPGQIVKCVGANPTGYCFVAKEIDCYYFKQQQQIKQIKEEVQKTEMLIFSGPFTANDDLMYEPLDDVLHEASSKNPSIVLLMGPFVSDENINHALTSNITYKQAFEQIVMKKVEAFAKQYPNKHVVLVPSVKDAFHRYCAFPQPPFFETSKCKNVHFVANPSAFEVNGIRVAVSTCDILKHLSGFERGGRGKTTTEQQQQQQTDRMTRLCSHMVGQMSMYPLFPPHPDAKFESHDATVPLRVGMDERVPDLIVLTSDLAAGGWKNALSGNKTMFVNPGKVCRGVNAGTFCKISSSSGENFAESARLELHKL